MRVLAPRVRQPALGHHRAEMRVGEHVDPGRGCRLAGQGRDDVLGAVGREAADAIEENELARRRLCDKRFATMRSRRHEARNLHLGRAATHHLLHQAAATVGDDRARHRLQQDAILVGDLLGAPHEDAARPVHDMRLDAGGDQTHDLVLQHLPIPAAVLVPYDEVHRQPLQPPVRMRLHQPPHEVDIVCIADLQQHDRQVARDRVAPQAGLPAPVPDEDAVLGAQRRIRVDDGTGETRIELCIGLGGIDLPQRHPAVRPCEVEHAVRQIPVLVLADERQRRIARVGHARCDVDGHGLLRQEREPMPDGHDRIQDRAMPAGQAARRQSSPMVKRRYAHGR